MRKGFVLAVGLVLGVSWVAGAEVFWNAPVTVYSGGSQPQIAVKGNTPVIAFAQLTGNWQLGYTEDLGQSVVYLGPAWNNYYPDMAVDTAGNTHLVWCWQNYNNNWNWEVYYQVQNAGSFSGTSRELVSDNNHVPWSQDAPRLAVDANTVHVIWPGSWRDGYNYRSRTSAGWGDFGWMGAVSKLLGAQVVTDGSQAYILYLPRTITWNYGLRYFTTADNLAAVHNVEPGYSWGSIGWENTNGVAPGWRGSSLDVAMVEDNTNSDDSTTGRVVLLLDVLNGSRSPIEVFNDGVFGSVDATAGSVTMAIDPAGNHYVIFSALNGGSDAELFMQILDAAGNKVGGLVQVTDNAIDDVCPDAVWGEHKLHLTWATSESKVMYRVMSEYPDASAPVFSPAYSVISGLKPVTITATTPGAVIRYTIDGTIPTATHGTPIASGGTVSITVSNTTLKAVALADGYNPSSVTSQTYTIPAVYDRPEIIAGSLPKTVDANLSDWSDTDFVPLDMPYNGDGAPDVLEASYAAKWGSDGKIYVAVKVHDDAQFFTPEYQGWDAADSVEVYIHTQGTAGQYYGTWEIAQQYVAGINAGNHNTVWTYLSDHGPVPASANFRAAGKVVGEWMYYEFAVTPFDYFGGEVGMPNIVTTLAENDVIGLDVCVIGRDATRYTGMKAENVWVDKSWYYTQFGLHKLGAAAPRIPGDANYDNKVDVSDLGILAANYGLTGGATWELGDFNGDGKVDVSDLGILAANYGTGSGGSLDFDRDARALGLSVGGVEFAKDHTPQTSLSGCPTAGLPLMAGLVLMGLFLIKLDE